MFLLQPRFERGDFPICAFEIQHVTIHFANRARIRAFPSASPRRSTFAGTAHSAIAPAFPIAIFRVGTATAIALRRASSATLATRIARSDRGR